MSSGACQRVYYPWDGHFGVMPPSWRKPSPPFPPAQSMFPESTGSLSLFCCSWASGVCQIGFEAWTLAALLQDSVLRASVCELPACLCNLSPVPHVPFSRHILKIVLWPPPRLRPWQGSATVDPLLAKRDRVLSQWDGRYHSPKHCRCRSRYWGAAEDSLCVGSSLLGDQGRVLETEENEES